MMTRTAAGLIVLAAAMQAVAGPAGEHVMLHVSFDANKGGTVDAERARGSGKGVFDKRGGLPQFADGIRGKGFLTGGSFQSIRFGVEGNIRSGEGTLSFWLRGIGWELFDRRHTEQFVRIGGKRGWVMIYSWIHFPVWLLVDRAGQRDKLQFPAAHARQTGQWNMLTVTWRGKRCTIYFNGLPVEKRDNFPLPEFAGSIVVGQSGKGEGKIVLDELTIYDRALSDAEVAALYHQVGSFFSDPFATVPRLRTPPAIDGKIGEAEWAGTAAISGLLDDAGYLARTQSTFYLGYDARHLYVACRSPIPERVKSRLDTTALHGLLRQSKTEFDTNVDADDAIEVDVTPDWPFGRWHRLVVNHINTHYDYAVNPDGSIELGWDPRWTTATSLGADGWSVEMAIELASFPRRPKPGDVWGLNLRRTWKQLQKQTDRWAWGKNIRERAERFGYFGPVGRIRFARDGDPFVRVDAVADLNARKAGVSLALRNPGPAKSLRVACRTNAGDVTDERNVAVAAKGVAGYRFEAAVRDPAASRLDVAVADGKATVFRARLPFLQRQRLGVYCRHYPSFEKAEVELDLSLLRDHPLERLSAHVVLRDAAGKRAALERTAGRFTTYYPAVGFETHDLKPGRYQLDTEIRAAAKVVARHSQEFEKRPLPPWHGNRIGLSDKVPPPFTPIEVTGTILECWGRRYTLGHRLLPSSIQSGGRELLAAPMALEIALDGGESLGSASGKAQFRFIGQRTGSRVAWRTDQQLGPFALRADGWLEVDGFLWTTLTITPNRETAVAAVRLDIPMRKDRVTLVNNYDYSVKTSGLLPKEGIQKGWMPLWLGDERGGLQWLTESNAAWLVNDEKRSLQAIPQGDRVVLRVHFCDRRATLREPLIVSFGIIATPVRPPTRGYWPELAGTSPRAWGYGCYQPADKEWGNPLAWPQWAYGVSTRRDGRENHSGPYVMGSHFRAGPSKVGRQANELLRYWFHEWAADASARWRSGAKSVTVAQSARSWQDFLVWTYHQMYKKHRYTGLYYDVSRPVMSDNRYAGAGFGKGKAWVPTWTLLGTRQLARRLYTMLRLELGEAEGSIRYHYSGQMAAPILSFAEMFVDGENNYSWLTLEKPCYWQHMTLARFRAQTMGHPFGPVGWWLPQNTRALRKAREDWRSVYPDGGRESRYILGLALLHNSALWAAYFPTHYLEPTFEALRACQLSNFRYDFLPYWSQKLARPSRDVAVSVYRTKPWVAQREGAHKRKALIVVFNQTAKAGDVVLEVDWKALGLLPEKVAVEECSGRGAVRRDGPRLILPLGAHDFALVGLKSAR